MLKYLVFILFIFFSTKIFSLEVTLTQGSIKPTPIAIMNLYSNKENFEKIGKNISSVILMISKVWTLYL